MIWNTEEEKKDGKTLMTNNVPAASAEPSEEDGETETHERPTSSSQPDSQDSSKSIEDSEPEEWNSPENTEWSEFALPGPTIREDRI